MDGQRPIKEDKGNGEYAYSHPAFGAIRLSRPSGHHNLFGSAVVHQHAINLEITYATMRRHNNSDWLLQGKSIIEVTLSEAQFAQCITGVGGLPTPVTIRAIGREMRPRILPDEDLKSTHTAEMREACTKATAQMKRQLKRLQELASPESKTISKAQLREIVSELSGSVSNFTNNLTHIQNLFVEAMEEVTEVSKSEIQTHLNHLVQQTGIEALKKFQEVPREPRKLKPR